MKILLFFGIFLFLLGILSAEEIPPGEGLGQDPQDAVEVPATVELVPASSSIASEAGLNPGFNPGSLALNFVEGKLEGRTAPFMVHLPHDAVPVKADILFSFDLTGSMGGALANTKVNSMNIMNKLIGIVPDTVFGVQSHMDYKGRHTSCGYSHTYATGASDYPYRLDKSMSASTADVAAAIDGIELGSGYDMPESYARVLYETYANPEVGWRSDSKKIVIMWGDALPHDCNAYACIGGTRTTGVDPGRDGVPGTADDLAIMDVLDGMAANDITLIALWTDRWDSDFVDLWDCFAKKTGGQAFAINRDGSIPGGTPVDEYIASIISDEVKVIDEFRLEVCDDDSDVYDDWLTGVDPASYPDLNVGTGSQTLTFDISITPPSVTTLGEYQFDVCAMGDGAEYYRLPVAVGIGKEVTVPPTPEPPKPPPPEGCFSGDSTVQVKGVGDVAMKDLQLGELVKTTKEGVFEPVYAFGHYSKAEFGELLKFGTTCGEVLEMTANHLLYVERDAELQALPASKVGVGDEVITDSPSGCKINSISSVMKEGLYAPLTRSGSIVVNGILASCYVSIEEEAPRVANHPLIDGWLSEHGLLHLLLSPFRIYCMGVLPSGQCSLPVDGSTGIMNYALFGMKLAKFGNDLHAWVQLVVGLVLLAVFGIIYALECSVGPATVPIFVVSIVVYMLRRRTEMTAGTKKKNKVA